MSEENASELLWIDTDRCGGRVCFKGTRLSLVFMVKQRAAYDDLAELKRDYTLTDAQWALVEREHEHANHKPTGNIVSSVTLHLSDLPEPPAFGFKHFLANSNMFRDFNDTSFEDDWTAEDHSDAQAGFKRLSEFEAEEKFSTTLREAYSTCPPDINLGFDEDEEEDGDLAPLEWPTEGHTVPLVNIERPKLHSVSWAFHNATHGQPTTTKTNPVGFHIPRKDQ